MSEIANTEFEGLLTRMNKQDFLQSSDASINIVRGLNLQGFQLGGGAVDFVLGNFRRPHGDIDMVYVVESRSWDDYVHEPNKVPDERISLQRVDQEPELFGVKKTAPIEMEIMGAPGIQMEGSELPLRVDFIEAYRYSENGEDYIMLPIYEGKSFIKIPTNELVESEIDGVKTQVPTAEVQYLIKRQAAGWKRTLKGGPPPDKSPKTQGDMKALQALVDMDKVEKLDKKGVGFNFSPLKSAKFKLTKLFQIF